MDVTRRWKESVLAVTAVAVLLAGSSAVVHRRAADREVTVVASGGDGRAVAAGSELSEEPLPTTTTSTPPPAPTTTTAAPRPTTTKAPTPATTTVANPAPKSRQSYSGGLEPRVPGGVRFPYQAGQTAWSATSNGMTMTVRIDNANPPAGAPVRVVMEATPPPGRACCFWQFGRDDGVSFGTQTVKGDGSECVTPNSSLQRVETTVTFNKAGRVEFFFQASPLCPSQEHAGIIYGFVEVGAGRSTSQGPSVPVLKVDHAGLFPPPTDPRVQGVAAFARDEDGYIAGFSVNWGDGSPVEAFPGDPMGCMQLPAGWPNASQRVMGATNDVTKPPVHRYAQAGAYTITVAAWSTGCDGGDEQRVTGSIEVHLG